MIRIDGKEVAAEGTLLQACAAAGVKVPTLCHDQRVKPAGHCRACLVEADGRAVPACTTPARDGCEVRTDTERLRAYRRDLGELILSEAAPGGAAAELIASWGATGERYGKGKGPEVTDASHPYLKLDLASCILCRLCLRACEEVQGQFVYGVEGRGNATRIAWGPTPFAGTECVACGACASACPTGAVSDRDRLRSANLAKDRVVRTTCSYCGVGCQLEVHAAGEEIRFIDGALDAAANRGHLCVKGRYAHGFVHHPDRLTTPLLRRNGKLEPASWAEALAVIAGGFGRMHGRVAGLSSSRCTNEENYLVQKWMRAGLGTNDVDCCARVCHGPSARGMRESFGTGAATNSLADLERADLLLVAGANATEAHPVTGARVKQQALRGAKLLVIDPRRTELASIADVFLQLKPGTNVPLLHSLACVLVEEGLVDRAFVDTRSEGFAEYAAFVRGFRPESLEAVTGVPAAKVREAARLYGTAKRPMQIHGLGMTEHYQGSEGVMLLCNLAVLVGAIGREGVGVNPLRGQNNVQGAADMGCQPDLLTGYADPADAAVQARFQAAWARPVPQAAGRTIPRMWEAARSGELRGMYLLGEDVAQTDPDASAVIEALGKLELLVVQELFLSETAKLAHVVLPGASFLEKDGTFTNGERRVQRVRQVLSSPGEARADWRILCDLMAATGYPQSYGSPREIFAEIARVAPAFAGIDYDRLEGGGLQWPVPSKDHPGTAILHGESFPRGKARLAQVPYLPSPAFASARPLTLVTGRVLEHYNAGSMTRRTENAELVPEDLLEIHPADAAARGIAEGDRVRIESDFGEATARAKVTDRVAPASVFLSFHFPETRANFVTGDVVDRLADCPEYKVTSVDVQPLQRNRP